MLRLTTSLLAGAVVLLLCLPAALAAANAFAPQDFGVAASSVAKDPGARLLEEFGTTTPQALQSLPGTGTEAPSSAVNPEDLASAIARWQAGTPEETLRGLTEMAQDYFHHAGYDVPSSAATDIGPFEENATTTFAYPVHDFTGDGKDDINFVAYCTDRDACYGVVARSGLVPTPTVPQPIEGSEPCGSPARVFGINGGNGSVEWERPLSEAWRDLNPARLQEDPLGRLRCHLEFAVGTMPLPKGGQGLLMYSWDAIPRYLYQRIVCTPSVPFAGIICQILPYDNIPREEVLIDHQIFLLDGATGQRVWTYRPVQPGRWQTVILPNGIYYNVERYLVNPLLMKPPTKGVDIIPASTQLALFTQEVGFEFTGMSRPVLPGERAPCLGCNPWDLMDKYEPRERITRVNVTNGGRMYDVESFAPNPQRSVVPYHLMSPGLAMLSSGYGGAGPTQGAYFPVRPPREPARAFNTYWTERVCCFDNTGDGIPDIPFLVREFSQTPYQEDTGPYVLDVALVLFDGATGKRLYYEYIEKDARRFFDVEFRAEGAYQARFEMMGDANGDNISDIVVHERYLHEDYKQVISVHNGPDGRVLWNLTNSRETSLMVLGDANGDGGNDFVTLDYYAWEWPYTKTYDLANVTRTPLSVYNGADGKLLWYDFTFNAPIDLVAMYQNLKLHGLPDIDGDGVGDLIADDPVFLPDLTVVHHNRYLSGADGELIFEYLNVGSFSFPMWAGDIDGNGVDDAAVLSGDINDLWITVYNSTSSEEQWSRRVLAPRIADAASSIPWLRGDVLANVGTAKTDLVLTFHFDIQSRASFFFPPLRSFYPRTAVYAGENGTYEWSHPKEYNNFGVTVFGATPATKAFERLMQIANERDHATKAHINDWSENGAFVGAGGFAAASLGLALLGPWRWRK